MEEVLDDLEDEVAGLLHLKGDGGAVVLGNGHGHYFRDGRQQQGDTRGARQEFLAMAVELLVIETNNRLVTSMANIFVIIINKKTCEEQDRSF